MNLAIISPQQSAYSETFIQAHRKLEGFDIHFYHGGDLPRYREGRSLLENRPLGDRLGYFLRAQMGKSPAPLPIHLLRKSFLQHKIDCVLAEYGTAGAAVLPVCKDVQLPLVVHFHGFDASHRGFLERLRSTYLEMFDYAKAVIAVSQKMVEDLKNLGCPPEKIHYNVYGPDDSFLSVKPSFHNQTLVSLGRLVDKKAPYYTILAFHEALKNHPDARLIVGGDGPLRNTCENLVRHLGMDDKVSLPGIVKREAFQAHLATCRAYVQHSITASSGDAEGTPVSILEAMAAGLPVISTTHAGIPDVVLHGQTGMLSPEHDVTAMANHMSELLEDSALAERMGAEGRDRITAHFTLGRHLNTLAEIIRKASRQ